MSPAFVYQVLWKSVKVLTETDWTEIRTGQIQTYARVVGVGMCVWKLAYGNSLLIKIADSNILSQWSKSKWYNYFSYFTVNLHLTSTSVTAKSSPTTEPSAVTGEIKRTKYKQ